MSTFNPKEFKVTALRECPMPLEMQVCTTPEDAARYWEMHIKTHPYYTSDAECMVVLLLNTRRRIRGHVFVSQGTLDTVLVDPRSVFRPAIIAAAQAIILMHNHPSGESEPSQADIRVTRDLIRAGQLLKIDVVDHVIVGSGCHSSLRALGYFSF